VLTAFGIRTKITICFLMLAIVMGGVFAMTSYFRIINAMHTEIQKHGVAVVKILGQMAAPYIFESDYATIIDIAEKLIEDDEIQRFEIVDANGKIWLTTHPKQEPQSTDDSFYTSVLPGETRKFRKVKREGGHRMEFVTPINALGKVRYLLKVEISLEYIEQQALQRIRENLVIAMAMVLVAAIISVFLARVLTTPLLVLVQGTRELSQGNLGHRIEVESRDETGVLSASFNLMAESLEKELSVRREAESKLQEYSEKLERIVAERTALLTEANAMLSGEIEERKKTEMALLESRERYRRFSEVTIDGIVFHNDDGIIDVNTTFTKMFGYPLEDLKGKDLIETICLAKDHGTIRDKLLAEPEIFVETLGKKQDGQTLPIELEERTLRYNDKILTVTSVRDRTERKQLEIQLQQAQRMEGIGRLAASIAHDLNNILSGIVTMPQILLLDLADDSPLKGPLQSIQQSGESAAVIVRDIVTLAGSRINIEEVIEPPLLVRNYIESPASMKLRQTHPGISIQLAIEEGVKNIKGSSVHLTKALMNLVKNGADAIEGEGQIVIGLKNVYVDKPFGNYETISTGDYVCLSVTDSGTGISPENIPFVFEPFYSKKVLGRSGTGLGMVIVWNTVKDHCGHIDITSNIGKGTEVSK
jgi:two-component system cell cycle sensor histidine kinase/response regulator CckA